ncbi:efflux RND transporter periplasmic adaptor subunit [Marispirochaeta aestuarii]|uniref:efflux RND transporter periplasmic adaptor subunit n=1 Tax=Marispirochaeta aestuarii TaxID=1963862 RepID=UPI002ABE9767|nr:efflux RND transporter periplasmic adaptor subunit [Marispirochaeta aestuarii]
MNRKRYIPTGELIALIILLLLASCQGKGPGAQGAAEEEETLFAVNVTKAVQGQLYDYLEVNGDIVAQSSVDIYADTSGKLFRLNVAVGDYVYKDQVIAEVDPSRPGQTFATSPVKSPITGTITRVPSDIGASISTAVPVATVSKVDSLEIKTGVAERYIARVRKGQEALVELEAYPQQWFRAFVSEVSPVVDPVTRTLAVTLAFREQDRRIKAGMFAKAKIIVENRQNVIKIPAECMIQRQGGNTVFVVTGESRVEARRIVPGILIDQKLEVVEGLRAGETVVIRGQTLLEDQAKVRIIDEIPGLEEADSIL